MTQDEFLDLIFTEESGEILDKLSSLGMNVSLEESGTLMIRSQAGMNVGMHWEGLDYPTRRTQLGFALFGIPSFLAKRYPDLDKAIEKRWTIERKNLEARQKEIKQRQSKAKRQADEALKRTAGQKEQLSLFNL
jgi:hypothetical protein